MFEKFREFLKGEEGTDPVIWAAIIVIGIILAVMVYTKVKSAPGDIGAGIEDAAENAKSGLDQVRYNNP